MLSLSVDIWRPVVSGGSQSLTAQVQALFAGGELGLWYDPSDISTAYQDSAGTTPSALNDSIGKRLDKSGRGNHATQPTAGSRPIYSARKNLSTKTEKMEDAVWNVKSAVTITADTTVAPDSMATADSLDFTTTGAYFYQSIDLGVPLLGKQYTYSIWLWSPTKSNIGLRVTNDNTGGDQVNQVVSLTSTPQRVSVTRTFTGALNSLSIGLDNRSGVVAGVTGTGVVYAWGAQLELGASATTYQRVNTATDYDTVGFPVYDSFDGVDDGLATGAITLGSDMDCFIALRRNSAAQMLFTSSLGAGNYGPLLSDGNSSTVTSSGLGAPTFAANGVAIAGGASATRGALAAAAPIGQWVIFETRNANFSAWAGIYTSTYTGFEFNGDIGGIILCPAQTTEKRNQIRTYLGAKVGLAL